MNSAFVPAQAEPLAGLADQAKQAPLLRRYRRYLAVLAFGLLATPLVVGFVKPDSPAAVLKEGRRLAPFPSAPGNLRGWPGIPRQMDAYLKDHFGLRQVMIRAEKDLSKPLAGSSSGLVLEGRDGRLFLTGSEAVRQSAGLTVRDEQVADTVATLSRINKALAARGVRFLVAVPPNAATIYQDDLPSWAQNKGVQTEYDLLLKGLSADGVRAVDLRPAVMAARAEGPVFYKHDTHWTFRGALAGFDALVEADGRRDWSIDPKRALNRPETMKVRDLQRTMGVGDLTRMLGTGEGETEVVEFSPCPGPRPIFSQTTDTAITSRIRANAARPSWSSAIPSPATFSIRW